MGAEKHSRVNQTEMRPVLVTGIGLVTPLGNSTSQTWARLIGNEIGISYSQEEKFSVARCDDVSAEDLRRITAPNRRALEPRFIALSLLACEDALISSGLTEDDFNRLVIGESVWWAPISSSSASEDRDEVSRSVDEHRRIRILRGGRNRVCKRKLVNCPPGRYKFRACLE